MSHLDTPEVQSQIAAKLSGMFKDLVALEDFEDVDPNIGDTVRFHSMEDNVSTYFFMSGDDLFVIDLTEEQIEGFLNDEDTALDFVDSCVYGVICDIEDSMSDCSEDDQEED